ncbi:MAG: DUF5710 domain-containing protein, partial [Alphaproteobacteria bacterium]
IKDGPPAGTPPLLGANSGSGKADRPPTPAMKKFAVSIARQKRIKPPRGYTKSGSICRAFLQEHAPREATDEIRDDRSLKSVVSAETVIAPQSDNRKTGGANTPLKIPFGNKATAQELGARYATGGWYAPPGVDLAPFTEKGWL